MLLKYEQLKDVGEAINCKLKTLSRLPFKGDRSWVLYTHITVIKLNYELYDPQPVDQYLWKKCIYTCT